MAQKTLFGFINSGNGVKRKLEHPETVEPPKKKFIKNLNQDSFDWYIVDEDGVWHCKLCRSCKLDNAYARGHSKPGKTTNHTRHAESNQHKSSVTRLKYKGKEALPKQVDDILTKEADSITTYMKCAYHQAKHELPKSAFKELINLADNLSVDIIKDKSNEPMYTSNYSLNEFHQSISDVIWEEKYDSIIRSQKFGIIVDESTDMGNKKQLLCYIQYLDEDGVKCVLLENLLITTASANADTITEKIKSCLESKNIDISKMVGIGTDGASVMTGKNNGVVKKLKEFAPSLIGVHCAAHRCSLATSQATKSIPELEAYSRTVTNIFYYFSNSALRSNKLVEIQTLLQLPSLKFANIHSVRWLSLQNAVEVLYRTYPALVVALEREAVTNSVAKGLLNEVTQYKFIGFTHLMMDILPFIGRLSKTFQTSALDFSKISPAVSATCDALEDLLQAEGVYMDKLLCFVDPESVYKRPVLESKASQVKENISENLDGFNGFDEYDDSDDDTDETNEDSEKINCVELKYVELQKKLLVRITEKYIEKIVENLRNRFLDIGMLEMLSIFDPNVIQSNVSCLSVFGKEKVFEVSTQFGLDPVALSSEYQTYKRLVVGSYKGLNIQEVCPKLTKDHISMLPTVCECLKICCVIPVSSVACERGFSTQNRIKSRLRTNLNNVTLNNLMRISEDGPALQDFNIEKAVIAWRKKVRKC